MLILPQSVLYLKISSLWQDYLGSEHDVWFAVFMMWLATEVTYWAVNIFFYTVEVNGWLSKWKLHKDGTNTELFKNHLRGKPTSYLLDILIYWISYKMVVLLHPNAAGPHDPLPSMKETVLHFLFHVILFDLELYIFHRLLHTKRFFSYHKKHHEVNVTFSAGNDHHGYFEGIVTVVLKVVPTLILGSHIFTVCVFQSFFKFFAFLFHCGYELGFKMHKIPFMGSPSIHDFHHYNGYNNYGAVFSIWDKLFGTYTTWEDKAKKMGIPQNELNTLSTTEVVALIKKNNNNNNK